MPPFHLNCAHEKLLSKITFSRKGAEKFSLMKPEQNLHKTLNKMWLTVKKNKLLIRRSKKNIRLQVLTHISNNFHSLNKKQGLKWTIQGLEKHSEKKSGKKAVKIEANLQYMNKKPLERERANFFSNSNFYYYIKIIGYNFCDPKPPIDQLVKFHTLTNH